VVFEWEGNMYLPVRPDFGRLLITSGLRESAVSHGEFLLKESFSCSQHAGKILALHRAIQNGCLTADSVHPFDWWVDFWGKRGIQILDVPPAAAPQVRSSMFTPPEGVTVRIGEDPVPVEHVQSVATVLVLPTAAEAVPLAIAPLRKKRRGPQTGKTEALTASLLKSLRSGELTASSLYANGEEAEATAHGVSRDTYRKARDQALSEFVGVNSDK
jgi:hypothetical protein